MRAFTLRSAERQVELQEVPGSLGSAGGVAGRAGIPENRIFVTFYEFSIKGSSNLNSEFLLNLFSVHPIF